MVSYYSIYFLFTTVGICNAQTIADSNVDNGHKMELCSATNHKPGKCVVITECDSMYSLLKLRPISEKNVNILKQSQCGFVGQSPKVCCALNDEDNPSLPDVVQTPKTVRNNTKPGNELPGVDICGMFVDDRLIYGKGTQLGSFPWLVLLEYQTPTGREVHCGGVLISSRYVLTAAHCISWKDMPKTWNLIGVRLGEHNTTTDPDCVQVICYTDCATPMVTVGIESKTIHEDYDTNDSNQYNDIALIRLAESIDFSEFVSPVCLPPAHDEGLGMLPFASAGWGSNKIFEGNDVKQDATLFMTTQTECQSAFSDLKINIREDQLCAARTDESKDICNEDSGGALMTVNPQYSLLGNYFTIGVMSYGPTDCSSKKPTVYTKVRSYLRWIARNMKP